LFRLNNHEKLSFINTSNSSSSGLFWLFNHVNPWLGILSFVLSAGLIVQFIINKIDKTDKMKKSIQFLVGALVLLSLVSCDRVAPNYLGVLMENYGKNGKSDYTRQQGRVNTMS
jgi:hypothetical protein